MSDQATPEEIGGTQEHDGDEVVTETVTTETVTTDEPAAPLEGTTRGDEIPAEFQAGQAEVQHKMDADTEQGYRGDKVDTTPNEAYSLESGPDAPSNVPDDRTRA